MLKRKQLPQELWANAIASTVYLINRSPSKILNNIAPHEDSYGFKPTISHLMIFNRHALSHILDTIRSKLNDKAQK